MTHIIAPAVLAFRDDGTPVSPRHDDIYHSAAGALAQARHVFLKGNGLPARWLTQPSFTVLELGFGLGVNFLATWAAWREARVPGGRLEFVSIEKHPFSADDLRSAHAAIIDETDISPLATALADAWPALNPGVHRLEFEKDALTLTLLFADIDDALSGLSESTLSADAIFLDGFAPAKNPEMWSPPVFASLRALTRDDATFATYTSAGSVKRALREHGFEYRKVAGFGGKRVMLVGKKSVEPIDTPSPKAPCKDFSLTSRAIVSA